MWRGNVFSHTCLSVCLSVCLSCSNLCGNGVGMGIGIGGMEWGWGQVTLHMQVSILELFETINL